MNSLVDRLLAWYDTSRRNLPWRENPYPYYILVSEFMLQQTRMETVLPYFDRFITALPTLADLAKADEAELLKLWEGLGYYRRVRNLQRTAEIIMADLGGEIPSDPLVLKTLPGIGDYVAGAIASTAYQVKTTALDGNVQRILSRLYCNGDDITKASTKRQMQQQLLELLPDERVGDYNQAMMELGALVCLPNGRPDCERCPIQTDCCAYHKSEQLDYPNKPKKAPVPIEPKTVLVIESPDAVLLEQFEPGLLEGLWRFPMVDGHVSLAELQDNYPQAVITPLATSRHVFSHRIWDMIGFRVSLPSGEVEWTPKSELASKTFPTALKAYRSLFSE